MPGMNSGLNVDDPTVVAAFRSALLHQAIIALAIFAVLSVVWVSVRERQNRGGQGSEQGTAQRPTEPAEPAAHRVLRIGFGLLWLLDGLLQAQPGMAAGLPSQVIEPAAASSPPWVQHLVNWAGTAWSYHPVQAGAAAVWIQVGIGLWLLAAPRGISGRLAGLAGVAWGLLVWIFGEAFGGIFAPGLTWLFGAPGAAAIYTVAGGLLALPDRSWRTPRLGRAVLAGFGLFLTGMAVLQAWPGRGFWQGSQNGQPGTLTSMIQAMTQVRQPRFLSGLVSGFESVERGNGFAVNLVAVIALAAIGLAFLTGRREVIRPALAAFIVLCLADWVLVEDFGFLGGLGTDPNSMIPIALLAVGGWLALTRPGEPATAAEPTAPEPATTGTTATEPAAEPAAAGSVLAGPAAGTGDAEPDMAEPGWRDRFRPSALGRSITAATFGTMISLGAFGVIVLGAVPMAAAQTTPAASTILAQSIDGPAAPIDIPAPDFTLTDQDGKPVTLSGLRGQVVLLTFLDPVCVSDCPLIAQEFRQAGLLLGPANPHVKLIAINVNPLYSQVDYVRAFDRQENLGGIADWKYLTSSPAQLRQVYHDYGVPAETLPAGAMLGHNDIAFVIDTKGELREELDFDPGPGTEATQSSFAAELADAVTQTLRGS
jgi:cytochrome oxidase Cu insertion factor (SCO1/SenC/PrrC family)